MAYKVIILYRLYMPSYFLGTFAEYPYEYYTGEKWGEPHRYDLMLNTGALDLKTACQLVKGIYQGLEKA